MSDPHQPPATDPLRMRADPLHAFVAAIWARAGSSEREARLVADHLVGANLAGHDSHGIGMIPNYVASWREGQLALNAHAAIVRDAGGIPVDPATWRQIRGSAAAVGFAAAELDAWTQRCTERA
ncbi:hypothetical protein WS63_07705 [Burkholderia stagnalis]|nr:hypothetical protein WS63_07705 [Burkholderia stagnalis]